MAYHTTTRVVEETINQYERRAEEYVRRWGQRRYRRPKLLTEWQQLVSRGSLVLDLGCGPGQDARHLRKAGFRSLGLDRTWPLLKFARGTSRRLPFVQGDLRRLPFRRGGLNGIWAAASLIHLPKPEARKVLDTLRRQIRPGGVLGATFAYGSQSGFLKRGWIPGRYFSRWHKRELERAVQRAGWEIFSLRLVTNCERKGRWLNLLARRPIR